VFRWSILLAFVACILVTPAAAQAPAPTTTVFDGAYLGVSRTFEEATVPAHEGRTWTHFYSSYGLPAPLTIVNGVARTQWVGTAEGSVSPQGALAIRNQRFSRVDAQIDPQGTVKGQYSGPGCTTMFVWRKQPG
jgi:hypothetical protein